MATTELTYLDLLDFPEGGKRYELFDGELVVTPAPHPRHQLVATRLVVMLSNWGNPLGWTIVGPLDLVITKRDVLEPDLIAFRPGHPFRFTGQWVRNPPDLVVEVASPSTRRRDLGPKAERYARFGVPEYWFVDHERPAIVVHRLEGGVYRPETVFGDAVLTSPMLPGLEVSVAELCAMPDAGEA